MSFVLFYNFLTFLKDCHASSQIQQLLDSTDPKVIIPALQLTRAILTVLPEFRAKFQREGLFHCLTQMSEFSVTQKTVTSAPASLATTPIDRSHQIPSGSKSEQRRKVASNRFSQRKKGSVVNVIIFFLITFVVSIAIMMPG